MIDVQIKYEPGNIVWAMYNNKPCAMAVNVIRVVVGHDVSKKHIVSSSFYKLLYSLYVVFFLAKQTKYLRLHDSLQTEKPFQEIYFHWVFWEHNRV